ncbi:VAMP-associated protein [Fistulina hepatica ATCC 64428]|uniref:VAMP-associated protein n=1 Tax=Fistulina hepatica ATCC 64428 TaxID=1128425 RepID=A0A0D7A1Q3_9AGAR|nr:VAMP-associated protein [Fistulina hepatica ATCC 64428]
MSVSLNPSNNLGFNRPLTQPRTRSLALTNHNDEPVAFKVKTTAPKLYCVRPNSGRVEPGETVEVQVMLQALREEPPTHAKCKDKFLIQSTLITPDKESMSLHDIWSSPEGTDESKIHQQKLRVNYLPPVGETVLEEDEGPMSNLTAQNVESHVTAPSEIPQQRATNGHHEVFGAEPENDILRATTPAADYTVAADEPTDVQPPVLVHVHPPPPSPPPPVPAPLPPVEDLSVPYAEALQEIERLRALLASVPSSETVPPTEVRRRPKRAMSDDGSTAFPETDVGTTMSDDYAFQQEGVPLNVVIVIAMAVFVTTYLFF